MTDVGLESNKKPNGAGREISESLPFAWWRLRMLDQQIDGGALLSNLVKVVKHYVVVSDEQATAVALWVVYSWLIDEEKFATHAPILRIWGPEADSGKSTLAGLTMFLARRAFKSVGITGAALFRSIEKWSPTLIIDEADTLLAQNGEVRNIVNSGWTRGEGVIRCVGDDHTPRVFNTFAPKVVAMKGKELPGTVASRSISIRMKPKLASEKCDFFLHCDEPAFEVLRAGIYTWASCVVAELSEAKPTAPEGFNNRRWANWRPLLAIAKVAGGEWPQRAHDAAVVIESGALEPADRSPGIELLSDVRNLFDKRGVDRFTTDDLQLGLNKLAAEEERRMSYAKDRWVEKDEVTRWLRQYGIRSGPVRLGEKMQRGWLREWFEEAFARYL